MSVETNQQLLEQIEMMRKLINELIVNSDEMCEYCKHNIPCLGKECDCYESGKGLTDAIGKYFDWEWSCMDFSFGDCRKLENTPCHECEMISGDNHFEWNGKLRGEFDG